MKSTLSESLSARVDGVSDLNWSPSEFAAEMTPFRYRNKLFTKDPTILRWISKLISESNASETSQLTPSLFRQLPHNTYHFGPAIVSPRFIWKFSKGSMSTDVNCGFRCPNTWLKFMRRNPPSDLTVSNWTRRLRQFCWKMRLKKILEVYENQSWE